MSALNYRRYRYCRFLSSAVSKHSLSRLKITVGCRLCIVWCCVFCWWCVVWCGVVLFCVVYVCGVRVWCGTLKTPPCVDSRRLRVYPENATDMSSACKFFMNRSFHPGHVTSVSLHQTIGRLGGDQKARLERWRKPEVSPTISEHKGIQRHDEKLHR